MIPKIKDEFPIVLQDDPKCEILTDKMESIVKSVKDDILSLSSSHDPMRCKSSCLESFANMMNVTLENDDSETQKRQKILNANITNKLFGTWKQNKIVIDTICNGNSKIIQQMPKDDWVMCGYKDDHVSFLPTWAIMGGGSDDAEYGILLSGNKTTYQKGIAYIDVDNDSLTEGKQTNLKEKMMNSTPIGMIIHFGYVAEGNEFIDYFIIGDTDEQI